MSIKNIVTGQLASITTYSPSTGQVSGIDTSGEVIANAVSLGTGNLQLTGNIISSTADTITIDPLGDGTLAGNVVVAGNLQVAGTLTYNDVVNATTNDLQWIAANNAINEAAATGAGLAVGPLGAYASFTYNAGSNVWQSSLPIIANGGVNANGALSGATTGSFSGNVTADYFIGNGSQLTDLNATNINTGTLAQARLANSTMTVNGTTLTLGGTSTITANAETLTGTSLSATVVGSSLTSVGTLTSLAVTGNITGGNIDTTGQVVATGNITGDYFIGNGSQLTGLPAGYSNANVASYLPTYTGNLDNVDSITASGNIIGANVGNSTTILQGDGGLISNISVAAGTQISSGTTSVSIDGSGGNIDFTVAGNVFGTISQNQVRIGDQGAGGTNSLDTVALGQFAGFFAEANTITIGSGAGQGHPVGSALGANSIAIGVNASRGGLGVALPGNTIVLNATGANLNPPQANSFFVAPVRNDTGNTTNVVYYNTTTKEVTYGPGVAGYANSNVANYLPTYTGNLGNVDSITASGSITGGDLNGTGILTLDQTFVDPSAVKMRILVDGDSSFIQVGNGTAASSGNLAFAPWFDGIGRVVINTGSGNITAGNVNVVTKVTANSVSLGTGNLQLSGNLISTTADIITIDPLGDGSATGNVIVQGNMQVAGTLTYNNIVNATTNDLQWIAANNAINRSAASGGGLSVGPSGAYASFTFNAGSNVWQSSLPLLANGGVNANGSLSGATTGSFSGNVTADYFIGNGSQLTGLYANSNVTSYLPTYTGNLGNVDAIATTGNITVGTGAFFIGDGGLLSNISGGGSYSNANVESYLPTYTGNLDSLTGNVTTTANISATGNISAGNLTVGNIGITGNITMSGGKISGSSGTTPAKLQHYGETVVAGGNLTGTLAINTTLGTIQRYTLTGSITINGFVNAVAGTNATLILKQDATGGRTLTSTMKFLGGVKTLSTAANAIDVLSVFYDGVDYLATLGKGYA